MFASHNPMWMKFSCIALALLKVVIFLVFFMSIALFGGAFHNSAEYLCNNLRLTPLLPHYITAIYCTIYIVFVLYHSKKWEQDQRYSQIVWKIVLIMNGCFVCISMLSTSLYIMKELKEAIPCLFEIIGFKLYNIPVSSEHGYEIRPQCMRYVNTFNVFAI